MKSRPTNLLFLIALYLLPFAIAGCAHFFGHAGAAEKPSMLHPFSSPTTDGALQLGGVIGIVMIVAGAIMVAASIMRAGSGQQASLKPGASLSLAGVALWFLFDFLKTFRVYLLIGAALVTVGAVVWWVLTHRRQLQDDFRSGGRPSPSPSTPTNPLPAK